MLRTIRVRTTGDYPPFTRLNADHQFEGQDIDLFQAFAKEEGYPLQWIKTTWPRLSQDLEAGLFEAAIGGISATPKRAEQFLLSHAIRADAKVILCHRDFASDFAEEDITGFDRSELRFIYNPGGTNEAFVKENLKYATLVLEPEMEKIFERLANKEVNAFITDIHEAVYRADLSQGVLVAVKLDRPLSTTEMVCLFPQKEQHLKEQFDRWLMKSYLLRE